MSEIVQPPSSSEEVETFVLGTFVSGSGTTYFSVTGTGTSTLMVIQAQTTTSVTAPTSYPALPTSTSARSASKSGTSHSTSSTSTSLSATDTSSAASPSVGPSSTTGALVGIAMGCVLAGVLLSLLAFFLFRRHRNLRKSARERDTTSGKPNGALSVEGEKAELPGYSVLKSGSRQKAELTTNANRHELDTQQPPWSGNGIAELEGSDVDSRRSV